MHDLRYQNASRWVLLCVRGLWEHERLQLVDRVGAPSVAPTLHV